MDFRRIHQLLWGPSGPPSQGGWRAMGCGGIALGLFALFFLRGVSATDAASYYEAWALVIGGAVVLIAVLMSKLRRS